ncbi:LpxL/LpxP family Kdo(2)-lipid IV(A) lauroyl/palmitoleoyl acyltransferase [Aliivibrio kagoshimensis]|uniref:LpxL/LpxP family Kdo(2)-lipid IV(A) lauroyl/palmitoleoyl acyltransferase n=1 Tax=Aliivibrio kagoshimensis TaxID=2910230 RepID=UPI003D10263F
MSKFEPPLFSLKLLHPKYWIVWFFFGLLFLLSLLPYKLQYFLGRALGIFAMKFAKSRANVARRNLELAFPEMSASERETTVIENFKNSGLAVFETGMAWFWPDWRIKKHFSFVNPEAMERYKQQEKGVLLTSVHSLNLELTSRALGLLTKGVGVYRPHSNPAYEYLQYRGRTAGGHSTIDRLDIRGMLRLLKKGGVLWYLPDHDYGRHRSEFVPFFAVPDACTTAGTSLLVDSSRCAIVTVSNVRKSNGQYEITIDEDIHHDFPHKDSKAAAIYMNSHMEKLILRGVDQYMWLHKRFKTMEDPEVKTGIRYK